jgi:hypothetical protein
MRTRLVVGLAFGALGVVVWGCSSSSGGSNPYPDVGHFCAAVAAAECQESGNSGMPAAFDNCSASKSQQQECLSFRASECAKGSIIVPFPGSTSAMSRAFTSGNVQPCIDAINNAFGPNNASSNGIQSISYSQLFGMGNLVDICEAVFAGSAGDGKQCTTNYDCTQMGETCAQDPLGTDLVCATPTPKPVGMRCADPGDQCTNGYCQTPSSGAPTCVALLANGTTCTADGQCTSSSHCSGGVCAALAEINEPCGSNADCDSSASLFCDAYHAGGPVCVKSLVFDNGQDDCQGYLLGMGTASPADGGTPPTVDAAPESSTSDAPTGG